MRRFLKIFLISIASFLLLIIFSTGIAIWVVFTPEKLTPIVRNQLEKHIPYQTAIGEVDLTLFKTFPEFGIRVSNFAILSPFHEAPSDTLLKTGELTAVVDIMALYRNSDLFISKLILSNSFINVFADSLGNTNYDLLLAETPTESDVPADTEMGLIDLKNIELKNLNLQYTDLAEKLSAILSGINAGINGSLQGDLVNGQMNLRSGIVSFEYGGERYLENALVELRVPAEINTSSQLIHFKDAFASINGLGIKFSGTVENDTTNNHIITDVLYELNSWNINEALSLVPSVYLSDYGIKDASGELSSSGKIKGVLSDTLIPVADMQLTIRDGSLEYAELPFPLREMHGEVHLYADVGSNPGSFIQIDHFEAKTPGSSFTTKGMIKDLFADMHFDLVSNADALLEEFKSFIPEDMDLNLDGRIKGEVKSNFRMSHMDNLELEKVKISGSAVLSDFSTVYDSLSMSAAHVKLDFALPNPWPSNPNAHFAFVKLASEQLYASKIEDYSTSLKNAHLYIEISDVRDTSLVPDIFCTFSMDSLWAEMDTLSVAMRKPMGYFGISPIAQFPDQQEIQLAFNSPGFNSKIGQSLISVEDVTFQTDILHDSTQEDIFLQWLAKGFLEMKNGQITLPELLETLEIPSIKMDFSHETFHIHESKLKIGNSDFGLNGSLNNVLSYSRGDSILRGDFDFFSELTDIKQIMQLTSGIGLEDENEKDEQALQESNNNNSGPYMVPRGVDLLLRANVLKAANGTDTARNMRGNIRVNDGILLLDDLNFTTPAADMQLTAMYRTPRKNHLYLGIDYHMMDIEIGRLLKMIPDIDTLVPMLRSFEGSGEFHLAVETYLDSIYNIKKSTLRGASSIRGEDLVLMDGETFTEIAKTLRFSKRAENRVDSLAVEFTIFREEIDVYPFLIVMDRYKAVVAGRHNFDLSFDYHISLVESPLPIRLGVDISGTMDNMRYRPALPRYAEYYRPVSRRAIESRQLELRRVIREALLDNIRE